MLRTIEIENIKGIGNKKFTLNVLPNKPSLLVAPNGYGKSSFATAFNSMNSRRIDLKEDDYHQENDQLLPRIQIEYQRLDGCIVNLNATNNTNTISSGIGYFVINSLLKPKGIGSQYGRASASLEIEDVVLVDKIPENISFNHQYRETKNRFGNNGKVLPNATTALNNLKLVEKLSNNFQSLQRAGGIRVQEKIQNLINEINQQNGTSNVLTHWMADNQLGTLKQIEYLNTIGNIINEFDLGYNSEAKSYLVAIQLIWLFNEDSARFRNACKYSNYLLNKQRFDITLKNFNCTWKNIRTHQTRGKLVVKFPKAIHISNGQRDILTFISMLAKAKSQLTKEANILIIDEVFDYLDDANLTAAQYYITSFIQEFTNEDKRIYPLILTHLNPNYFKNFAFSKQKVYYLEKSNMQANQDLSRLLKLRSDRNVDDVVKNDISKHLVHYDPTHINRRDEFRNMGVPELWGETSNFYQFLFGEVDNYLNNRTFCPFAVCGGVRVKIEELAYNKIQGNNNKSEFLKTKKTRSKLEKADDMGVVSPESHYLLGVIYNEGMHWKNNQDNISPIASKLENGIIKKLIKEVFE